MATPEPIYADPREWSARLYREHVEALVRRLHAMADRIAREAEPAAQVGRGGVPRFTAAAHNVLHGIAWDMANADAHGLVRHAALVDAAERGELDP